MFKRNRTQPPASSDIDTLLGRNTHVSGDIVFTGGFHLDGQVTGNVRAEAGVAAVLVVSEHGCIEGSVEAPHVVLNGTVKGDIIARERVELGPKARVNGNVFYGVIEMAIGAEINGKLIHEAAAAKPVATAAVEGAGPDFAPGSPGR